MNNLDLAREVTCAASYEWTEGMGWWRPGIVGGQGSRGAGEQRFHIVAYDFGVKRNILRQLAGRSCRVTVVPATTPADEVLAMQPDGIFLSNGPGDPAAVTYAIDNVRQLLGRKPIFGICLGHQILALALGASTYKLKFGHRGGNQPVQVADSGAVQISSHNHGFAVDAATLPPQVSVSHVNLNDNCCEGLVAPDHQAFSIQYHPESAPGPHDSDELFDRFIEMMKGARG
jgi:carbamoyl-phosphate synthase small subunit